jgi:hypothetical protein
MALKLERAPFEGVDAAALDAFPDRVFSQKLEWIRYGVEVTGGEPVLAALRDGAETVGWFSAIRFRKFGAPVLGSPFMQWNYPFMGFNLTPGVPRSAAFGALPAFAFKSLGCAHVEVFDYHAKPEDGGAAMDAPEPFKSFVNDLDMSEEALFGRLKPSVRNKIRQAQRAGVTVEAAAPEGFAGEFYGHLLDVFARQGRKPPFGVERVEALIRWLAPAGQTLLLRARGPDGDSIASCICVGDGSLRNFWGQASRQSALALRPNQILNWEAMRRCRAAGATHFDWGGGGAYKLDYGATPHVTWRFRRSASPVISLARKAAYDTILAVRVARERLAARTRGHRTAND